MFMFQIRLLHYIFVVTVIFFLCNLRASRTPAATLRSYATMSWVRSAFSSHA